MRLPFGHIVRTAIIGSIVLGSLGAMSFAPGWTGLGARQADALVTPTVSISVGRGKVGTTVTAYAQYYPANAVLTLKFKYTDLGTVQTNGSGSAQFTFKVPNVTAGKTGVTFFTGRTAKSSLFEVLPGVWSNTRTAAPGTRIHLTMRGFSGYEKVTATWSTGAKIASTTLTITGDGHIRFTVPNTLSPGSYRITVSGSLNHTVSFPFQITG